MEKTAHDHMVSQDAEIERLRVSLANIATMTPHYVNGVFEDHSSYALRLNAAALAAINPE